MKKISTAYILLFAGIFSLCIFSFIFYTRIQRLMNSYELVNKSTQVLLQADKLFLNLRDAASSYSSYLNKHHKNLLDEFNKSLDQYPATFKYLYQLEAGNQVQQNKLQQINFLAENYMGFMRQTAGDNIMHSPGDAVFDSIRTKLNRIRTGVNDITDGETAIMKKRSDELHKHIFTTPLFLLVFSLISIVIIAYAFLSIIKQIKKNQSLQVSEKRFKMLIKQAPVAITVYKGPDSIIEIINDAALKILGVSAEEVTGKPLFATIPVSQYVKKIHNEVLSTGKTFSVSEFLVPLKRNGVLIDRYFDLVYEPLFDHNKRVLGIIAVGTEITDKVAARKKVEESENRFRALIENSMDIVALCNKHGIFTYVSASVKNILGYNEAELYGKKALNFVHTDDISALNENNLPLPENKNLVTNTIRVLHKNGSWRWIETTVSNLLDLPYVNAYVSNMHDVTEQKNIQDILKQSEENFRQLADLIPQIVWTARTDGLVDYYNKRWYEYTGFSKDAEDQSWIPVLHHDDIQPYIDAWHHSIKTGEPYQVEYRLKDKRKPGSYRWFLGKALPIKDDEGVIIKWFGTCTDINDQKTITEKLEQLVKERAAELTAKNKDLNEAQRLAHIGSWEWDIEKNKISWTDELYRIYGLAPGSFEFLSFENYSDLTYKDDREYSRQIIEEALTLKKPFDFYHRIKRKDGDIRTIHGRGKVYTDDNNRPVRMAGTAQDITETLEIQNKINELNQTFNFAEQTSLIGSFRYNLSSGTFAYSDNLYRILGCKPGEFEPTFQNFTQFVHPEDFQNILSEKNELEEENISNEALFRVIKRDGSIIHVRNTGIFITEENEKIYIGTLQDVTSQHNKEMQLLEQNNALEEMNKELASFSYIASHDLQEPLRKIRIFTKRLAEKEVAFLSDDAKEYFNRIDNAARRMQQLIDDLLSYSKTNAAEAHFELTDIDKLVKEVADNLKEKITLTNTIIESSGLEKANVIPFQFQQLLTNLITNSIKFSKDGIAPHIRISHKIINGERIKEDMPALKKAKYHHYIITDNGIGFDPQYNEQVFGLFQRLHGRNEFEGTGIGLAICKKIAENHNGIITASGHSNSGATFDIYIPVE
jgi:PAS domain S-box-containing protein